MNQIGVSVVIPAHGSLPYLDQCLASILDENMSPWLLECVVVFDRAEPEIKSQIMAKYNSHFWVYLESDKPGIVPALNLGINKAKGSLIARIDADDTMGRGRIDSQFHEFLNDPTLVLLGSQVQEVDESGRPLRIRKYPYRDLEIRKFSSVASPFAHPAVMFRKDVFENVGRYRDFYALAEDFDLFLRMLEVGKARNLSEILTNYRIHGAQESRTKKERQLIAELAVKNSKMSRARNKKEPNVDFQSSIEWWRHYSKTASGRAISLKNNVRLNFHDSKSKFARIWFFLLMITLMPIYTSKIVFQKYFS